MHREGRGPPISAPRICLLASRGIRLAHNLEFSLARGTTQQSLDHVRRCCPPSAVEFQVSSDPATQQRRTVCSATLILLLSAEGSSVSGSIPTRAKRHRNTFENFLNGRFANSAFCILAPGWRRAVDCLRARPPPGVPDRYGRRQHKANHRANGGTIRPLHAQGDR